MIIDIDKDMKIQIIWYRKTYKKSRWRRKASRTIGKILSDMPNKIPINILIL